MKANGMYRALTRALALALAALMMLSTGGFALRADQSAPEPSESREQPSGGVEPGDTPAPGGGTEPENTPEPGDTPAPGGTAEPDDTAEPTDTPEPGQPSADEPLPIDLPVPAADTYILKYHLNPPDGTPEGTQENVGVVTETQTDGTFTLKSVGRTSSGDSEQTMFSENSNKAKLIQGQYDNDYYFAGWSKTSGPFTSYADIDCPISEIGSSGQNYRGFQAGTTITIEAGTPTELYAVWVKSANSGLFGYVLTDAAATFASTVGGKMVSRWQTSDGQQLGDNGKTSSGSAQKYVVYDGGYGEGSVTPFTVTAETPSVSGKTFIGWYEKAGYIVLGGDQVPYGGKNSVYSLNAIWGTVTGGDDNTVTADGNGHGIKPESLVTEFTGGTLDSLKKDENASRNSHVKYTYQVTKDGADVTGRSVGTSTDGYDMPLYSEPGVYQYTITATLEDADHMRNAGAKANGIRVGTVTKTLTIENEAELIYHLNISGLTDMTSVDSKPVKGGAQFTYTVRELGEAFPSVSGAGSYNAQDGHITVGGTMYYFMGWSTDSAATSYENVNYRAQGVDSNHRQLVGDKGFSTTALRADLYAIWSTAPAMLGYTMTLADTRFGTAYAVDSLSPWIVGRIDSDTVPLGDNTGTSTAKKYVVLDEGHKLNDPITVTSTVPTDLSGAYQFLFWYNDKANSGSDPNTGDAAKIVFPSEGILFGNVNTVYSLNAAWGKLTAPKGKVPYDGTFRRPGDGTLDLYLPSKLNDTADAMDKGADGKYTVTVTKMDVGGGTDSQVTGDKVSDAKTGEAFTMTGSTADGSNRRNVPLAMPGVKEPGVYNYTVKARFTDEDDVARPTETLVPPIEATGQFIIYPRLDLTLVKVLANGNDNVLSQYQFNVAVTSGDASKVVLPAGPVTVGLSPEGTAAQIGFTGPGTYTIQVSEVDPGAEAAPGVSIATPQSFTVTVNENYTITAVEGGDTAEGNGTRTLTFTNTYSGGDLVIAKRVVNNGASVAPGSFHFKVELENKNITTKDNGGGEMRFEKGVAEFDLANGQSIRATGLPAGMGYTVTEDPADGYSTAVEHGSDGQTPSNAYSGTIGAGEDHVTFTNTYTKVGKLTVTKTVTGDAGADTTQMFQMVLKLTEPVSGAPLTGTFGGVRFDSAGEYAFSLDGADKNTVTFSGLPAGAGYTVTEQNVPLGYTPSYANNTGSIPSDNDTVTAAVTNTYHTGSLQITKNVAPGGNTLHAFTIGVSLDPALSGTYTATASAGSPSEVTFTGGYATVSLAHSQSITISGLPAGVKYRLTEPGANDLGYDTAYSGGYTGADQGVIEAGDTDEVTVTNTYRGGSLTVTKTVTGMGADMSKVFTFAIVLDDTSVNGPRGEVEFTDGEGEFTLKGQAGENSITIPGLPAGARYTVTETNVDADGYTTTSENSAGLIVRDTDTKVNFTNDYHPGKLTVQKVVSGSGFDPAQKYEFRITLTDHPDCNDRHGDLQFSGGVATFELQAGQKVEAEGLYVGTEIVIEELTRDDDFEAIVNGELETDWQYTCSIPDSSTHAVTATFNNRYKTGGLKVSKTVAERDADRGKPFTFTVTLTKDGAPLSGVFGGMSFDGAGQCSFTLTDGDSLTAIGVPAGAQYTVTEAEANMHGYKTTVGGAEYTAGGFTGTISDGDTAEAAFTNTYESGSLTIIKSVTGGGNARRDFYISVDVRDGQGVPLEGRYGGAEFTSGVAIVTLNGSDHNSITIPDLPNGASYSVAERWAEDYETSYAAQTGSITTGDTASVTVTNAYPGGSLTVSKTVAGTGADANKDFHFTVTVDDAGVNGPRGEYTHAGDAHTPINFTDGVAQLTLRSGETATIQGLREGVSYRVTEAEADQGGYVTSAAGDTGTIIRGDTVTAAFTNKYCPGSLTIAKTVTGVTTTADDGPFSFTVELGDTTFSGVRQGVVFTGGRATLELRANERVTLDKLPLGTYTVTEAHKDGYVDQPPKSGTLTAGGGEAVTVSFVNQANTGTLEIVKRVTGDAGDRTKAFRFHVEVPGCEHTHSGLRFTGGRSETFTLADGDTRIIQGLPVGVTYTVVEEDAGADGYTTTSENATGSIASAGDTVRATFTNHKELPPGVLTVTNTVTGAGGDKAKAFDYVLTVADGEGDPVTGSFGGVELGADGTYAFTLTGGGSLRVEGLPGGAEARVVQTRAEGYATSVSITGPTAIAPVLASVSGLEGEGEVEKGKITTIAFINDRPATGGDSPANPGGANGGAAPDTGDGSDPGRWAALLGLSALGLGVALVPRRKRKQ